MNTFFLNLAGYILCIKFIKKKELDSNPVNDKLKNELERYIKEFKTRETNKPDFCIEIESLPNPTLLIKKKEKKMYISYAEFVSINKIRTYREISIFQFQFLLRTILDKLLGKTGDIMLHASSVSINNKGYIFVGNPNAGKSTAARNLGTKYTQLSDDTVVIRQIGKQYFILQTPFVEKNHVIKKSGNIPLKGIFFLKKSQVVKRVLVRDKKYSFAKLIEQTLTEDQKVVSRIKSVMKLASKYDFIYNLYFDKKPESLIQLFESFE